MVRIQTGLVSGINYASLINDLLKIQRRPITMLKRRVEEIGKDKLAYADLSARLLAIKGNAIALSKPSTFNKTTARSSNESIIVATGDHVATIGSYQFTVNRLARTHQIISNGYETADNTPIGAGTLTLEIGNGFIDRKTRLDSLNAQRGVDRGSIRIKNSLNQSFIVNLETAVTVQDVLDAINASGAAYGISAGVRGDRLVLVDSAGGANNIEVFEVGDDTTARDLGLRGVGMTTSPTSLVGAVVNYVDPTTKLDHLNDGTGVRRAPNGGVDFLINFRGVTYSVNLSAAKTLQDVITTINAATGGVVTASIDTHMNALILQGADGDGDENFTLVPQNGSNALVDLGLWDLAANASLTPERLDSNQYWRQDASEGELIRGNRLIPDLNGILTRTLKGGVSMYGLQGNPVNDFRGVAPGSITLTDRAGTVRTINLQPRAYGELAFDAAAGATSIMLGPGQAENFAVGDWIRITQRLNADGTQTEWRRITAIVGDTISFAEPLAYAHAVGSGIYSYKQTIGDYMNAINSAGTNLRASFNESGNGLLITDIVGGANPLSIAEAGSTTATDLGINTGPVHANRYVGRDLDPQYISLVTRLSTLNGGRGVQSGSIRIVTRTGTSYLVNLAQETTIGEVIADINAATGGSVRARINDTGDGILLQDFTGGTGRLRVEEVGGGRTARDLNILGEASLADPAIINGSFEYSISIGSDWTLNKLRDEINKLGIDVTATVINDGSANTPHKLGLLSKRSGLPGRIVWGITGATTLSLQSSTNPQNAILLYGNDAGIGDPLLVEDSDNTVTGVIGGLTLDLRNASATPVVVTVTRDIGHVVDLVKKFVENFNAVISKIKEYTSYDPKTQKTGSLFSDTTLKAIHRRLYDVVIRPVVGLDRSVLNALSEVGIKVDRTGKLTFNETVLRDALDNNLAQVRDLFTLQNRMEIGTPLSILNNGRGVDQQAIGNDIRITLDRAIDIEFEVDISNARTVGDVLTAIRASAWAAGAPNFNAHISADGFRIVLFDPDSTGIKVENISPSRAASDLGIERTVRGTNILEGYVRTLSGAPGVMARINDELEFIVNDIRGPIVTRNKSLEEETKDNNRRIEDLEKRLKNYEERLIRTFTNLEIYLAQSESLLGKLNQQFQNMTAGNRMFAQRRR